MGSLLIFLNGLAAYGAAFAALLYMIGFCGGLLVPKSIDTGVVVTLTESLYIDLFLLGLFAVQHSIMARPAFKRRWTRIVPPAAERSAYVLATSIALALLFWQWRPIPSPVVWRVDGDAAAGALWAAFWLGWLLLLASTFLISHFELFGLHQAYARLTGRAMPPAQFRTPLLYRYVRHPIYLGVLLGVWSTPVMTGGHLLFAVGVTAYIFLGIALEERDLIAQFGVRYRRYRADVGMLLPRRPRA
jgi:protein-S-isoprenylcysteine O-methyltransferase Ste14